MNLATTNFSLPYDQGDLITDNHQFDYSLAFDKYYLLDSRLPLARGEVIELAIKNAHLIYTKQTRDIRYRASNISCSKEKNIVGTYLSSFIPIARFIPNYEIQTLTIPGLIEEGKKYHNQFFEAEIEIWYKVLPLHPHVPKREPPKPIWVKLPQGTAFFRWKSIYEKLRQVGIPKTPSFEYLEHFANDFIVRSENSPHSQQL